MTDPIPTSDARNIANYTVAEAARWLGLAPATLRTWSTGQTYATRTGQRRAKPVMKAAGLEPLEFSFWNLVECSVLSAMRKTHGVSFQKVRKALDYVEKELREPRPLIQAEFKTDGVNLFVERYGELISASESGQSVIREILNASLTRIDADASGLAARMFLWSRVPTEPRIVSVDPRISFGRPTLEGTGIPVEILLERFRAGDTIESLALDYRVDPLHVQDVVRWAARGTAAA